MAWIVDTYTALATTSWRERPASPASRCAQGGIRGRTEATGRGVAFVTREVCGVAEDMKALGLNSPGFSPVTCATIMRQQRIGRDVERHAQEDVGGALVELAGQPAVGDIELEQAVAGRQRHLVDVGRIPGA